MNLHHLIRGNNIIWSLLYYDELIQHQDYQLSYFKHANEDYYNCAHAVAALSKSNLRAIEEFYVTRKLAPAFYTDPISEPWLLPKLVACGYEEVPSQKENWWLIDLTAAKIQYIQEQVFLKYEPSSVNLDLVHNKQQLEEFIKIDQETNLLTESIARALKNNILSKKYAGAENYYLLGTVENLPAFCGCIGIYDNVAYFAEGGTLKEYRERGLHSYMTQKRLIFAFSKGAKLACITCTPTAYTNKTVKKLGFSLACSRRLFKKG